MDERVQKLSTPEQCRRFISNAQARDREDLVRQARQRMLELQAAKHGASAAAEKEALQAIYAYEAVLSEKNGKRTRASRTWQMIDRHGILPAVERAVDRPAETKGYTALVEMGLEEFAFEAVILRHPAHFSESAIETSKKRLSDWAANGA